MRYSIRSNGKVLYIAACTLVFALICLYTGLKAGSGRNIPSASETPSEAPSATEYAPTVFNFVSGEQTGFYVSGKDRKREDVTKYVTAYSGGTLYMDPDGIAHIFECTVSEASPDEVERFHRECRKNGFYSDENWRSVAVTHDKTRLVFFENSACYLMGDGICTLDSAVVVRNGRFSIPVNMLAFSFGTNVFFLALEGDNVILTLS